VGGRRESSRRSGTGRANRGHRSAGSLPQPRRACCRKQLQDSFCRQCWRALLRAHVAPPASGRVSARRSVRHCRAKSVRFGQLAGLTQPAASQSHTILRQWPRRSPNQRAPASLWEGLPGLKSPTLGGTRSRYHIQHSMIRYKSGCSQPVEKHTLLPARLPRRPERRLGLGEAIRTACLARQLAFQSA
jgi:hypothetical protein